MSSSAIEAAPGRQQRVEEVGTPTQMHCTAQRRTLERLWVVAACTWQHQLASANARPVDFHTHGCGVEGAGNSCLRAASRAS
jgi:hypothetical protein